MPAAARPPLLAPHGLGGGRLRTFVARSGSSVTTFDGRPLTPGEAAFGTVVYVRDLDAARYWTAGLVPGAPPPDAFEGCFAPGRAAFRRRDGDVETTLEIAVSPEADVEVRRIGLANHGPVARHLEVTTCVELVPEGAGTPSVTTGVIAALGVLVAETGAPGGPACVVAHTLVPDDASPGATAWETDRARFLGPDGSAEQPAALRGEAPLSGATGAVAAPVLALRRTLVVAPGARRTLTATLGVGGTRAGALTAVFAALAGARTDRAFAQAARVAAGGETTRFTASPS